MNRGSVSPMIQLRLKSSRIRITIASPSPMRYAPACCEAGSFPTRIEMKTMLSMPRTISSAVSVRNAIQDCGSDIHSMLGLSVSLRARGGPRGFPWYTQLSRHESGRGKRRAVARG